MKRKIIIICAIIVCFISISNVNSVKANVINNPVLIMDEQVNNISHRADVIEIRYRYDNGVYQYRRWNRTQNRWEDPDWINL